MEGGAIRLWGGHLETHKDIKPAGGQWGQERLPGEVTLAEKGVSQVDLPKCHTFSPWCPTQCPEQSRPTGNEHTHSLTDSPRRRLGGHSKYKFRPPRSSAEILRDVRSPHPPGPGCLLTPDLMPHFSPRCRSVPAIPGTFSCSFSNPSPHAAISGPPHLLFPLLGMLFPQTFTQNSPPPGASLPLTLQLRHFPASYFILPSPGSNTYAVYFCFVFCSASRIVPGSWQAVGEY